MYMCVCVCVCVCVRACAHNIFFIYLFTDGFLACLYVWAVLNNIAMSPKGVDIFLK